MQTGRNEHPQKGNPCHAVSIVPAKGFAKRSFTKGFTLLLLQYLLCRERSYSPQPPRFLGFARNDKENYVISTALERSYSSQPPRFLDFARNDKENYVISTALERSYSSQPPRFLDFARNDGACHLDRSGEILLHAWLLRFLDFARNDGGTSLKRHLKPIKPLDTHETTPQSDSFPHRYRYWAETQQPPLGYQYQQMFWSHLQAA